MKPTENKTPGSLERMVRPLREVKTETIWLANMIISSVAALLTAYACWATNRALDAQSKQPMSPQIEQSPKR